MKQNLARQTWKNSLFLALLILAISGTTIFAVERLFIGPLKQIQKGAQAIIKGDFQYRIPWVSKSEIGKLADNFNHMAKILGDFFGEIEDKNRQLTEQVAVISRSKEEWQETFDSITDLLAVIDRDGRIIRANRAFREYFALSEREATGKKCDELPLGISLPFEWPQRSTTREVSDDRTGKAFQISLFPSYTRDGDFLRSVLIIKDITEKKESEMHLIMNERLAALGQLASGIAHEVNNPLATVRVCTEGLLKRVERGRLEFPLLEKYLRVIKAEVNRCKQITNGMLSFVRKRRNGKETINLPEILDQTLEMLRLQGGLAGIQVLRNYKKEKLTFRGYEGELQQVFLSVLLNALEAMGGRGNLTIETGAEGGVVFTRITDTGPGIPSDHIGRVFDPFFTTKREKGGTGLGLSIAKKIIEQNEGTIQVTSEEEKGTTFTIVLPI
jgi:PAS domain S-box-containing protein